MPVYPGPLTSLIPADPSPSMTAAPFSRVYGVSLASHLQELGRDIALPIEACVLMLLSEGMQEEGLFRLAAGASVLKRLKQTMASDPHGLEAFCSDPHAVAGACWREPWAGAGTWGWGTAA